MNNIEKTALTRIFVDLIKADNILDISEMDFLREMMRKYNIDTNYYIKAQKIDFGLAVNSLKNLPKKIIVNIINDVKRLALSDDYCAPEEAYLLMALSFCLNPDFNSYCKLISTPTTNISIEKGDIIYTETLYDKDVNSLIKNNLRYIVDDFKLAGLDFVYIPRIAEDFKNMKNDYLHSVIEFLAPTLSDEEQTKIFDTLRTISTKDFCDEFLIKKIGLDPIFDSDPSILLQVCNSNDRIVYLHIALGDDILKDLRDFVDLYKSLTKFNTPAKSIYKDSCERFFYFGFHRALFDILAFPGKDIESRILIDVYKKKISFMDIGESLNLHTKQMALYTLIIQQSICTRCHELQVKTTSEKRQQDIKTSFSKIYGMLSCSADSDYKAGLTPALSHIKKAIMDIRFLDNAKAYIPENIDGAIKVKIKPSKVYILDKEMHIIPILESKEWTEL